MSLEIINKTAKDKIATVYIAKNKEEKCLEFVESTQPPLSRQDKWVLIVSTLFGCPVNCPMCDAGGFFQGKVSTEEIFAQIDHMVLPRFPDKNIICKKFKIQFARMGEPALNPAVLEVLEQLPQRYNYSGELLPSVSTVAPKSCENFLTKLINIKDSLYNNSNFQMQFSIHTTDQILREQIIPIDKWNFTQIADFGQKFHTSGDKKISLNFALAKNTPISTKELQKYFDPDIFIIKITPVNPTNNSAKNNIESYFTTGAQHEDTLRVINGLQDAGYEVILSIGDLQENQIGSNCGQYLKR